MKYYTDVILEEGVLKEESEYTKEFFNAMTDEQIKKLTLLECNIAIDVMDYHDPKFDKFCERASELKALQTYEYSAGSLTVAKIKELISDLNDTDVIEIYDTYTESCHRPTEVYSPEILDKDNHRRLIITIDTD